MNASSSAVTQCDFAKSNWGCNVFVSSFLSLLIYLILEELRVCITKSNQNNIQLLNLCFMQPLIVAVTVFSNTHTRTHTNPTEKNFINRCPWSSLYVTPEAVFYHLHEMSNRSRKYANKHPNGLRRTLSFFSGHCFACCALFPPLILLSLHSTHTQTRAHQQLVNA